ncbi:transcription initiation factor TFIID [Paenibacillus anaericanus]|uniref:transcription initiation factor TFIID n=1 Tax=Paenibacillus anaericanus TaxID=170367 RepID=UPI001B85F870|nr:transcription initiation factor TFIID [Paenibacillus anaericanus]
MVRAEVDIKNLLDSYAADYDRAEENLSGKGDDQSSIHYPALFLFIGDKSAEAAEQVMAMNNKKWDNSDGVMYFQVTTQEKSSASAPPSGVQGRSSSLTQFVVPKISAEQGKTVRRDLYQEFQRNEKGLYELNMAMHNISSAISQYGRLYASFDRIHISVITRVDDPLNVLVPEITLLAGAILSQSFKSVQSDLYALISERESVGYSSGVGMAFLRELDHIQDPSYSYTANLHVTEEGLSIPVHHSPSPLFDLVYMLSDKNELGMTLDHELQNCYEIISHVSLLKNRKPRDQVYSANNASYNNTSFKNNLMAESGRQGYVSAGFSKVKRPHEPIALTVLYHFYHGLLDRMKSKTSLSVSERLEFFGAGPATLSAMAEAVVPSVDGLTEMQGLMSNNISYAAIRGMSMFEAEEAVFGSGAGAFFHTNYVEAAQRRLDLINVAEDIAKAVRQGLKHHDGISLFHVRDWSDEANVSEGVISSLQTLRREIAADLENARGELEGLREGRVEDQPFQRVPLMDKHNLRGFIRYLFGSVYARKVEIVKLEMKQKLLLRYERELERLHRQYKESAESLDLLMTWLRKAALDSISRTDGYIGQNIMEYYEVVTEDLMIQIESKRGNHIFFEEHYLGEPMKLLEQGLVVLTEKLISVCRNLLLTSPHFALTFEEELLQRSNVTINYDNKAVLSKDELFKRLYQTLEDNAAIQLRLYDYTQEHRYVEKYLFGDFDSEFIRYAFAADEVSRMYRLGCLHEKRSSGVEKLNLMGGFHPEDLLYYRNGKMYYETYVDNGYEFHGIDLEKLPPLR